MSSLTVTFHKCNNDPREIPKTWANGDIVKTCEVIEPFNIETPVLKLTHTTQLYGYAFASITLGSRTYIYAVDPNYRNEHGIMYITLNMSYIDTYTSEILSSQAHITRCGDSDETMIEDSMATTYSDDIITCIPLGSAFTSGHSYIWVKGVTNKPTVTGS